MKNILLIICVSIPVALIPVRMMCDKYQKERDSRILGEGVKTTGTVTFKDYLTDEGDIEYLVGYKFTANGTVYKAEARYWNTRYLYDKAVVGKEYTVRYLPGDREDIEENSRIYLDDPVKN